MSSSENMSGSIIAIRDGFDSDIFRQQVNESLGGLTLQTVTTPRCIESPPVRRQPFHCWITYASHHHCRDSGGTFSPSSLAVSHREGFRERICRSGPTEPSVLPAADVTDRRRLQRRDPTGSGAIRARQVDRLHRGGLRSHLRERGPRSGERRTAAQVGMRATIRQAVDTLDDQASGERPFRKAELEAIAAALRGE